ncbi:MAG: glycosyltransferase family 4 protein, partial [Candidatus Omnitrophota bacterium]
PVWCSKKQEAVLKAHKVLHVIKTLRLGGAEANLLNLVEAMDPSRFENIVAYSAGGELEARFVKAGVRLFKFADGDHKLKSIASLGIVRRLSDFIRRNAIDIVHTHTFNTHVWGGIAAKLVKAKLLEQVHDFRYLENADYNRRRGASRQNWAVNYLKNFSDRVVVLTDQNARFIADHRLYPSSKVRVLHNGIPLPALSLSDLRAASAASRDKFGIARDAQVILTPIRLAPEKNADLILRIAPEVIARHPRAVFVIAGDGPLKKDLDHKINSTGLGASVKLIGFEPDVKGLLGMTDILLLPSFLELHSIALLEAMSTSTPVVISRNVGCHSDFITNGENGFLLDPFLDQGWAQTIDALLEDCVLRKNIGANGRKTCERLFDIRDRIKDLEAVYDELLSEPR